MTEQSTITDTARGSVTSIVPKATKAFWALIGALGLSAIVALIVVVSNVGPIQALDEVAKFLDSYGNLVVWVVGGFAAIYWARVYKDHQQRVLEAEAMIKEAQAEEIRQKIAHNKTIREDVPALANRIANAVHQELSHDRRTVDDLSGGVAPSLRHSRPPSESVFGLRSTHFQDEKNLLAESMLSILSVRIEELVRGGKRVILIVDAGTTLHPFFERFGKWMVERQALAALTPNPDPWSKRFVLVTNSIGGIESLGEHGRMLKDSAYSEIACRAEIVPGQPLVVYSASVGELANRHIRELRDSARRPDLTGGEIDGSHIIALTTGNYIILDGKGVPIPIARGKGHRDIKTAMFDIADEVFVVGPLGKMIVEDTNSGVSLKAFNEALHYSDGAPTEDRKPYVKVPISDTTRVFAVTTYRGNAGSVFAKHSDEVRSRLYNQRNKVWQLDIQRLEDSEFTKVLRSSSLDAFGHVMVRFNHFGVSEGIERLLEMPHSNIRHPDVARRFFGVPAAE